MHNSIILCLFLLVNISCAQFLNRRHNKGMYRKTYNFVSENIWALKKLNIEKEIVAKIILEIKNGFLNQQVSTPCQNNLNYMVETLLNPNSTDFQGLMMNVVVPMLDSSGRPPPGFLQGALTFWGYPKECERIKFENLAENLTIKGSYNRIFINLNFGDWKIPGNCDPETMEFIGWDFCLPKDCSNEDDALYLSRLIIHFNGISPICAVQNLEHPTIKPTYKSWVVIAIWSTILSIGILASIFDYFIIPDHPVLAKNVWISIFLSFSLYKNIQEIYTVKNASKPGQIGPIHIIRFLSISWVIMGHVYETGGALFNNLREVTYLVYDVPTQILLNSYFSVDSFFFLSGLLVAYIWFKEYKKNKRMVKSPLAWIMFYVHRFLRLSPPFFLMLGFYGFVFPLILRKMPLFMSYPNVLETSIIKPCSKSWWTHFVYLSTYIHKNEPCYGPAWYLDTDMQIYWFTPILLVPIALKPKFGIFLSFLAFLVSTGANFATMMIRKYPINGGPVINANPNTTHTEHFELLIYRAPWIRCQIYIIGFLVGYLLQIKPRLKINPIINISFWALSFALMLTVVLCLRNYDEGRDLPVYVRGLYSCLARIAWGLGLSWIIISCYYGYGGPINKFMSWSIWVPLGRLSYCVYLIHLMVVLGIFGLNNNAVLFSSFTDTLAQFVVPSVFFSFLFATFYSAAFEIPFLKIENILLGAKRSTQKKSIEIGSNSIMNGKISVDDGAWK